jgi:hypothetical protein
LVRGFVSLIRWPLLSLLRRHDALNIASVDHSVGELSPIDVVVVAGDAIIMVVVPTAPASVVLYKL